MPIIEFHLLEGRSQALKRQLCESVTDTVVSVLGVRRDQVRILIHTLTPDDFSVAGVTVGQKQALEAERNSTLNGHGDGAHKDGAKA